MVTQLCKFAKSHCTVDSRQVHLTIHKLCLNKAVKQQQKNNKDFFLITKKPSKTQAAKYSIHEMKANLGCVAERICGEKAKI